jgi:hypothetical protein
MGAAVLVPSAKARVRLRVSEDRRVDPGRLIQCTGALTRASPVQY